MSYWEKSYKLLLSPFSSLLSAKQYLLYSLESACASFLHFRHLSWQHEERPFRFNWSSWWNAQTINSRKLLFSCPISSFLMMWLAAPWKHTYSKNEIANAFSPASWKDHEASCAIKFLFSESSHVLSESSVLQILKFKNQVQSSQTSNCRIVSQHSCKYEGHLRLFERYAAEFKQVKWSFTLVT